MSCPNQLPDQCQRIKSFCLKIQEVMPVVQNCQTGGKENAAGRCEYAEPCVAVKSKEECVQRGYTWCGPK